MFVRCFWSNVSQSPSFFSSFLRLVCSLKIGLTFLQLLQHHRQMNPCRLFTFYWYQYALCVSRSLVPVNCLLVPATGTRNRSVWHLLKSLLCAHCLQIWLYASWVSSDPSVSQLDACIWLDSRAAWHHWLSACQAMRPLRYQQDVFVCS